MPKMDYSRLYGRIKAKGFTQDRLAEMIGITPTTLSAKLKSTQPFKQREVYRICEILEISKEKIGEYFFSPES